MGVALQLVFVEQQPDAITPHNQCSCPSKKSRFFAKDVCNGRRGQYLEPLIKKPSQESLHNFL